MTEAEIVAALPIVHGLAGRARGRIDRDELISAGMLALVKAAHDYDGERGASFKTYAFLRVRGAIQDELRSPRRWNRYRNEPRVEVELQDIFCVAPDQEDHTLTRERIGLAKAAACQLKPRERCILARMLRGQTCAEIAKDLGVSAGRISQLKTRILARFAPVRV